MAENGYVGADNNGVIAVSSSARHANSITGLQFCRRCREHVDGKRAVLHKQALKFLAIEGDSSFDDHGQPMPGLGIAECVDGAE